MYGDIVRIEGNTIFFEDNKQQNFDAIILATGNQHNLESFLNLNRDRIDDLNNVWSVNNPGFERTDCTSAGFMSLPWVCCGK